MGGKAPAPRILHATAQSRTTAKVHALTPREDAKGTDGIETRPCFTSSWIDGEDPRKSQPVAAYSVSDVQVVITSPEGSSSGVYSMEPPEYGLRPGQLRAIADTIDRISGILPEGTSLESLAVARPYVKETAKNHIYALLNENREYGTDGLELEKEADALADILGKYTAGYGVLETLINDDHVQDVYIDAPSSQTPVYVVLRSGIAPGVRQKCRTNLFVGRRDLQGLVSRIKFETGLPFSEAHPVLEADLPRLRARVTILGPPISERGVSVAIRKRSGDLWTLPRLIANGTLSPLLSSFLWASLIGRRAVLVAGSRGAGKTTLLSAMLLDFPLSQRILVLEDTPEIPVRSMQELGFDVQTLRFSSEDGLLGRSADDALKVSLRMGESAIVVGEVRGGEAKVLYESMRAGSAGSAVIGTIHGNSAKGVLDRAVEDLGVSERAFSSTDLVAVVGLIRSPDGVNFCRRVVEVAEVRWNGSGVELVSLFEMSPGCTCAKPTAHFSASCKTVAGISDALGVPPEKVMDAIKARAHANQVLAENDGRKGACRERIHVSSNEMLTRDLLSLSGTEEGLVMWKEWYERQ